MTATRYASLTQILGVRTDASSTWNRLLSDPCIPHVSVPLTIVQGSSMACVLSIVVLALIEGVKCGCIPDPQPHHAIVLKITWWTSGESPVSTTVSLTDREF